MLVTESSPEELGRSSHNTMDLCGAGEEEKNFVVLEKKRRMGTRKIYLWLGEEAQVDLVVVDQRQTYNASCRVPVCMVVDQSVKFRMKKKWPYQSSSFN